MIIIHFSNICQGFILLQNFGGSVFEPLRQLIKRIFISKDEMPLFTWASIRLISLLLRRLRCTAGSATLSLYALTELVLGNELI